MIEKIRSQYTLPPSSHVAQSLDRLLRLVTKRLYTRETHFLLELLGNADDNFYEEGVRPAVHIELRPDSSGQSLLWVKNNEKGFRDVDVEAMCSVANSTKQSRGGSIGRMGIGWKSVFMVAKQVQVHSNGFHFAFDSSAGQIGYIMPIWVAERRHFLCPNSTNFLLELKGGKEAVVKDLLRSVQPELLLFLRRLEVITISDASGWQARLEKEVTEGITTLSYHETATLDVHSPRALATRSSSPTPSSAASPAGAGEAGTATGGPGPVRRAFRLLTHDAPVPQKFADYGAATSVSLAVPLAAARKDLASEEQPLCAYLPVRPYGFRVILQANFELTTSRDNILESHEWNRWLRYQFTELFLRLVQTTPFSSQLLELLPQEADLQVPAFWSHPVRLCLQQLAQVPLLPTVSGTLRAPRDVCLLDPAVQDLVMAGAANASHGDLFHREPLALTAPLSDRAQRLLVDGLRVQLVGAEDLLHSLRRHPPFARAQDHGWSRRFLSLFAGAVDPPAEVRGLLQVGPLLSPPCGLCTFAGVWARPVASSWCLPYPCERAVASGVGASPWGCLRGGGRGARRTSITHRRH